MAPRVLGPHSSLISAAPRAGPLLCLPVLSRLIPVGPSPSACSQKAGGDNCVLSDVMGKSWGSSEAALSSPARRTGKASEKGVVSTESLEGRGIRAAEGHPRPGELRGTDWEAQGCQEVLFHQVKRLWVGMQRDCGGIVPL